jgi:diamine N-acetyltransferase
MDIELRAVTQANWREALRLAVAPDQQRFVSEYTPIVAVALAKAYLHLDGALWAPYAIYAGATMVGFVALAFQPGTSDQYWIFHFFIDQRYQGCGYGQTALQRFIELVTQEYPTCQLLQLVVHPENERAQRLYTAAGFRATGAERWGEPVYQLAVHSAR